MHIKAQELLFHPYTRVRARAREFPFAAFA
jgi:hypothetical protein